MKKPLPEAPQPEGKKEIVRDRFSPESIITWLNRSLPNANQVKWIDVGSAFLRFEWRGKKFQINVVSMHVEEFDGRLLVGSNEAALIQALLDKQRTLEIAEQLRRPL